MRDICFRVADCTSCFMGRFLGSHPELVLCGAAIGFQVFPIYQGAPWNTQVWFRHGPHYHTAWRLQPDPATRLDNHSILTLVRFPPVLLPDIPLFSLFRTLVFIQRTRMLTTQGHCSEVAPNADLQKKNVQVSRLGMPGTPTEVGLFFYVKAGFAN